MEASETANNNMQKLITERDNCLPSIISSLDDGDNVKLLDNIKLCIKYLPTYTISHALEGLLQYIIPVIKRSLYKVYEDNFLLSDTVDDDMIINMLKENLQAALDFIQIIKTVLDFLTENISDINLSNLKNIPQNLAKLILSTFKHCRSSPDAYKNTFNVELLEIFRVTQEVHLLFLKLFESCIIIRNNHSNSEFIELNKVLEIICNMSEVLSEISIKSMSDNWKGYIAIVQKFSSLLSDAMDLKQPIQTVNVLINNNFNSLENLDVDPKLFTQMVKITGFLIKVALKLFDIFWNQLEIVSQELLALCCTIYGYPVDTSIYQSEKYPSNAVDLMNNSFHKPLEPLLLRLTSDSILEKILLKISSSSYSFGLVRFLANILNNLILIEPKSKIFNIVLIVRAIFNSIKLCYADFFWENQSTIRIFDNLVLNITSSILIYDSYTEVESILFENVLQEHIWSALLALEVWTLLLHNSTPQIRMEILLDLIKNHQQIDFGTYTDRLEQIYLKCLMQRIFKMLPIQMKNEIIIKFNVSKNVDIWKMIGLHNFPIQRISVIEDYCTDVVDVIETIDREHFSLNSFNYVADALEVLSTVQFNQIRVNSMRLVKSVHNLWEFGSNPDLINNNVFKFFIHKLCQITSTLMLEFSGKELIMILTQLKFISNDDCCKLMVCDVLSSLSRRPVQHNQDESKIRTLITDIIYPNLLRTKNSVIKQNALEVIHKFAINGKHDVVKSVTKASNEMQGDISNYLQKNVASSKFDKEYLTFLGSFKFQHECITWRKDTLQPRLKKQKLAEPVFIAESRGMKEKQGNERTHVIKSLVPKTETRTLQLFQPDDDMDGSVTEVLDNTHIIKGELNLFGNERTHVIKSHVPKTEMRTFQLFQPNDDLDGSVTEVLDNIKGEIKCLSNVLKTEKLSRKNASDIKLIANQLLSML